VKTLCFSASKGGKEIEQEFTTEERADADVWANNYYIGCVVKEEVEDAYYDHVVTCEIGGDADSEDWMEETTLDKYRAYLKGLAA
jgi:hypothetical protein